MIIFLLTMVMLYEDEINMFFHQLQNNIPTKQLFLDTQYRYRPDLIIKYNQIEQSLTNYFDVLNTFAYYCYTDLDLGLA